MASMYYGFWLCDFLAVSQIPNCFESVDGFVEQQQCIQLHTKLYNQFHNPQILTGIVLGATKG